MVQYRVRNSQTFVLILNQIILVAYAFHIIFSRLILTLDFVDRASMYDLVNKANWMTAYYAGLNENLHTIQNNKYQVSHKYCCFSY